MWQKILTLLITVAVALVNSETVVYFNDLLMFNGYILNGTKTGIDSPCVVNPLLSGFRPSNCISGTERFMLGEFYLATINGNLQWVEVSPKSWYSANAPTYTYNGTHWENFGVYEDVFKTMITSDYWLGADRNGTASWFNSHCQRWTTGSFQERGMAGAGVELECTSLRKMLCVCSVPEGTIPGTTRTPTKNPTQPTRVPTKNPSKNPTQPTRVPTKNPTQPTSKPTANPTTKPTLTPTGGATAGMDANIVLFGMGVNIVLLASIVISWLWW